MRGERKLKERRKRKGERGEKEREAKERQSEQKQSLHDHKLMYTSLKMDLKTLKTFEVL